MPPYIILCSVLSSARSCPSPTISIKNKPLGNQAQRNGGKYIRSRVLLDENYRYAHPQAKDGDSPFQPGIAPSFQPYRADACRHGNMQRRTDAGGSVHPVKECHDFRQQVLPGKYRRPQILVGRIEQIHRRCQQLDNDKIGL